MMIMMMRILIRLRISQYRKTREKKRVSEIRQLAFGIDLGSGVINFD